MADSAPSDSPGDTGELGRACVAAAAALRLGRQADGDAAALLQALGYAADPSDAASSQPQHRSLLLDAAARMSRLFRLAAPDSPGLAVFGGEVDPHGLAPWWPAPRQSVSGTGLSVGQAFEGCVGEAVEFLSGFERPEDSVPSHRLTAADRGADAATAAMVAAVLDRCRQSADTPIHWVTAQRLTDGAMASVPADLSYRRDPALRVMTPPGPLSVGCAAEVTFGGAVLHGLLELIERDAAALWWRGGRRGRLLPLEHPALRDAAALLQDLRAAQTGRRSWVLDITTDLGIPSVAAVSFAADGRGFCCGTAARTSVAAACHAALREMCQMELAHRVVLAKYQERGEAALNDVDRHHLRRFNEIDAADFVRVHPLPPPMDTVADSATADLLSVVERLARLGLQPCVIDQTRSEFGIPVARVLCPGLEQEPSTLTGARLLAAISETGGNCSSNDVPLM